MLQRDRIAAAIRAADSPAIVAYLTAGYPEPAGFLDNLRAVAAAADAVEIGVPFSDPMADGVTIQRSSQQAIARGVSLRWILDTLAGRDFEFAVPVLLMSYLNPLLIYGYDRLARDAARVGISGFMVPDLPFEESAALKSALDPEGLALVQFVTPVTPPERMELLCAASQGFVYAVTKTGITGGDSGLPPDLSEYLDAVSSASTLPVCAGFGVRSPSQVREIAPHASGVIVGSALVEVLEEGGDVTAFLQSLRSKA